MKLADLIESRRNIKNFKPEPLDEELVLAWLTTASYAPNHRMTEPWEIVMIGPEARAKLNHKADFGGAPVVLAIVSKPAATSFDRDEQVMAASCFAQNFLLAAHEAGAGVRWASLGALPRNKEIMGVPEDHDVIGVFGVGYPSDVPEPKERTPIGRKLRRLP